MARGFTLNVSLTESLERYVREKVDSGGYESASEVIRESLRLSKAAEEQRLFWADVREKIAVARSDAASGRMVDGETAMDEIIAELAGDQHRPRRRKRSR